MKQPTAFTLLRDARAMIEDPDRWTQFRLASDSYGGPTSPGKADVASVCAAGAVIHAYSLIVGDDNAVYGPHFREGVRRALTALADEAVKLGTADHRIDVDTRPGNPEQLAFRAMVDVVADFNDEHEHDDVLELFDCALTVLGPPRKTAAARELVVASAHGQGNQ